VTRREAEDHGRIMYLLRQGSESEQLLRQFIDLAGQLITTGTLDLNDVRSVRDAAMRHLGLGEPEDSGEEQQ
jgi:hypothetical protein